MHDRRQTLHLLDEDSFLNLDLTQVGHAADPCRLRCSCLGGVAAFVTHVLLLLARGLIG